MNVRFQRLTSWLEGKRPGTLTWAFLILVSTAPFAEAQPRLLANLNHTNRKLAGEVVDYTHNHGSDRRIQSAVLGMPRDLYLYLPPGYSPNNAYPLLLFFHVASVDEHIFIATDVAQQLDRMIQQGEIPPVIMACPDGSIAGETRGRSPHSFYVNGQLGKFQDHIVGEVVPFLMRTYSIRPERQAHGILGTSAGGFGAMNIAIKHRNLFGNVAALAGPMNLRYSTADGNYKENFDPATFRWKDEYDPDEVVGAFYFGLRKVRAKKYLQPVFGSGPGTTERIMSENPADLLFSTDLKPGELAIYLSYPGKDNWNFDAQAESFAWLAQQKGIDLTVDKDPHARHTLVYFRRNIGPAFRWMGGHLGGPVSLTTQP
ncbi:alpha/beta hydrolase [Singulisphaera sp. PoT]|uniref:alpha/beta hydrolase n=1 Tax=Singulisphaera sp. PoT TaxID=3411797 RepID=UPI003BF5FA7B